jgi:hypothetical protein
VQTNGKYFPIVPVVTPSQDTVPTSSATTTENHGENTFDTASPTTSNHARDFSPQPDETGAETEADSAESSPDLVPDATGARTPARVRAR